MITVRHRGMVLRYPTANFLVNETHAYALYTHAAGSNARQWVANVPFDAIIENGNVRPELTQQKEIFE